MTTTKNETILIQWEDTIFSENIYAWFEYGHYAVLSDKLEDLMLPQGYSFNHLGDGVYEIFEYNKDCDEDLYCGRLFTPKGNPLES